MTTIALAAFFTVAGALHFVIPGFYLAMMPSWVPAHRTMVVLSGIAEMAGGLGVLHPATRRAAGIGLILLLVVVFPANVQMLLNAKAAGDPTALLWLRLPLQGVFVWWAWRATVRVR